ncbi:MAG: Isopentenyl-diphosphate Delta-isomerase [Candidatus Amesbacteria bacterium GW2011_GWA2_42_12]|uniref:Isopentenyl-diphosphate delta-isomerase n=1 Tax=Candidatus Amesbacteria bacterium GW2011_GWA2_42_12 TaxID=1618356 RepID=A0A0G0Y138_9BACT|nr:MAG: Isopentenyl-diphosphate Delta-isomerase [Candidatus Amesbacteria bacterium GW2011_GWA2_42_12]
MQTVLDQVTLVDEHDHQIGVMDKVEAHRGEGKRHRASSVFLFNKKGELLIQQRSKKKIVGALQWANTSCGNVRPNETPEECAYRRLREELGITTAIIQPLYTFEYHVKCNAKFSEWEIDHVFVGKYDGEIALNLDEVVNYRWMKLLKLQIEIINNINVYAPWLHIVLNDKRLLDYNKNCY